jgi:ribosomal protein S27AE
MSTMQTPPPADQQQAPAERRCPRCGSAMAPDQEWCLACGAAATTEVAEPRGWRVPVMLSGALVLLGVIGVILAIVALSGGSEKLAQATPTPSAAVPPAVTPAPTLSPLPSATPSASPDPNATADPNATVDPNATATADPNATVDPNVTPTPTTDAGTGKAGEGSTGDGSGNTDSGSGSTSSGSGSTGATSSSFPDWPGGTGWTVFIESATTLSKAESVATSAQGKGNTVGILHSDSYSSLNPGYYVVFTEKYSSESAAEDGRDAIKADYPDAYVRKVKQ